MCLTIPGKIKEIKEGMATVINGSRTAQIDLGLVLDAKVGDWVLYATERAIKIISEEDAKEIISLLEEKYRPVNNDKLPEKFVELISRTQKSNLKIQNDNVKVKNIYQGRKEQLDSGSQATVRNDKEVVSGDDKGDIESDKKENHPTIQPSNHPTKQDIEYLLSLEDKVCLETLYAEANLLRKQTIEDFVCIHGIIEFSNYCKNNCLYCGIRHDNSKLQRYRMTKEEIVAAAKDAVENEGYKLIVLQSGEDDHYSDEELVDIISEIKKKIRVFIFISVGERSKKFYKNAFLAGASGSLIRFETSNEKLYGKLRPEHSLNDRISSIKYQQKLGYYIASGSMVGLPGQTISDIADDLFMIKKLGIPMISSGPFIPASNTPLENLKFKISNLKSNLNDKMINDQINGNWKLENDKLVELFLKYIAIARLMMPEIKIPVTTALETLDPENGRHRGLLAGANALMFNLTPEKFAGNYNIYDNKYREREKVWQKYGLFKGEESYEMLEKRLKFFL